MPATFATLRLLIKVELALVKLFERHRADNANLVICPAIPTIGIQDRVNVESRRLGLAR